MSALGYESAFTGYFQAQTQRSLNSPEAKAKEFCEVAASSLEIFLKDWDAIEATARDELSGLVQNFRDKPSPSSASFLIDRLSATLSLDAIRALNSGRQFQLRRALVALVDYAKLFRSNSLTSALLKLKPVFAE